MFVTQPVVQFASSTCDKTGDEWSDEKELFYAKDKALKRNDVEPAEHKRQRCEKDETEALLDNSRR